MSKPLYGRSIHTDLRGVGRGVDTLSRRVGSHGPWFTFGDTDGPVFLNGFHAPGGSLQTLRLRLLIAGGFDIQGSVSGGAIGLAVGNLAGFIDEPPPAELRLAASDDAGGFVVFRLLANLDLIFGI